MFTVDTNVLVYASDRDAPEHERCQTLLEEWRRRSRPWFLTWGVVYEFMRVVTHPRIPRRTWSSPAAWEFVHSVLRSPALTVLTETDRHETILAQLVADVPLLRGNLLHDAHTVALMMEHGVSRIYTRDMDFHRFGGIDVIDPLVAG